MQPMKMTENYKLVSRRLCLGLVFLLALVANSCAAPGTAAVTPAPAAELLQTTAPVARDARPISRDGKLLLATTTSTQDSGLLDYLLPDFVRQTGVEVDVVAVGTGQALALGRDGNADLLLVHDPDQEREFMAAGYGIRREDVMYNDFVLVGSEADPAGVRGMSSAADAFRQIAEARATFVSRGDASGTHAKELSIWKAAGIEPTGDWYISAGQGMGELLTMAAELQAYTLSDRATYLARQKQGLNLALLVEGDPVLLNPYRVIAINPKNSPAVQAELANQFIDWIISVPVQEEIAQFGRQEYGQSLFMPDSALWRASKAGD